MPKLSIAKAQLTDLRLRASRKLGLANSPTGATVGGFDALAVLHELASSPQTAPDALALLHELQVYQVELEMQAEDLRDSRLELEAEMLRQRGRYAHQPVACITVDRDLVVHELNLIAAHMLGISREGSYGLPLDGLLPPQDGATLRGLIARLEHPRPVAVAALQMAPRNDVARAFRVYATAAPGEPFFLLVFCEEPIPPHAAQASGLNASISSSSAAED